MSSVFSPALLDARIRSRGLRVEEIATVTGLSYGHVNRLRRGEARPSAKTIEVLAEVLGCEPGDLFADDGKSRGVPPPDGHPLPLPLTPETREKLRALLDLRGQSGAA